MKSIICAMKSMEMMPSEIEKPDTRSIQKVATNDDRNDALSVMPLGCCYQSMQDDEFASIISSLRTSHEEAIPKFEAVTPARFPMTSGL